MQCIVMPGCCGFLLQDVMHTAGSKRGVPYLAQLDQDFFAAVCSTAEVTCSDVFGRYRVCVLHASGWIPDNDSARAKGMPMAEQVLIFFHSVVYPKMVMSGSNFLMVLEQH